MNDWGLFDVCIGLIVWGLFFVSLVLTIICIVDEIRGGKR
jgi:Na+-transporting methylmalonyl-CoA/oxaloacetate decarboxylase gamma subunit